MIFDWDEYSLELCSEINELNEYLPLYAFINTHSTFDVHLHEMRMVLYFFEYGLNAADDIAQRIRQYTDEYMDTITPPLTKALFTYVKEGNIPSVRRAIWRAPRSRKARWAACSTISLVPTP